MTLGANQLTWLQAAFKNDFKKHQNFFTEHSPEQLHHQHDS